MSQHDFNIANQGFPATRADINNAFAALASTSSGASAPSTTFANQFWYDTANNLLMFRNEADSAWITLAYLDQATNEWEIRSAVIQAVDSAGVIIKTDDGTSRITVADDGTVTIANALIVSGNFTVDNGTIKLDGNYPTGTGNVALGDAALSDASFSGNFNVAVGDSALEANTTGNVNTAVGYRALLTNTTGYENTAIGPNSLKVNTTGLYNTAVGSTALFSNTTSSNNTAVGYQAGFTQTTGHTNTNVGVKAGYGTTTGIDNTYIGPYAGIYMTTGSKNVIIGRHSGNFGGLDIRTSSNNIVLSDGDGNPRLYYNNGSLTWFSPAIRDKTTAAAANMHIDATGGYMMRSTSSLRYKNTVNDATHGLTELLALRPVTYKGNNDGDTVFGGLIAEEVHDAGLTEFVQYNDDGEPDALAYSNMVSLCIKAIQEQQATITALEARITALENA